MLRFLHVEEPCLSSLRELRRSGTVLFTRMRQFGLENSNQIRD
jgi:hypothetical protein